MIATILFTVLAVHVFWGTARVRMAFDNWVSWRQGKNYVLWHWRNNPRTTLCGIDLANRPAQCFTSDAQDIDPNAKCITCRRLRLAERIP